MINCGNCELYDKCRDEDRLLFFNTLPDSIAGYPNKDGKIFTDVMPAPGCPCLKNIKEVHNDDRD